MVLLSLIRTAIVQSSARSRADVWSRAEVIAAAAGLTTGLATAVLVYLAVRRIPWPRHSRLRLAALQLVVAALAAVVWLVSSSAIVALASGGSYVAHVADRSSEMLLIGTILFAVVAGLSLGVESSARAARAEALAARTQLAALRAQLHPHFLFNALHSVVQLIPVEPQRAADAAVLVADLLRTTLEEQRDEVTLEDEWRFVSRYLDVERLRFGDRLTVRAALASELLEARVPAFALQTLVENAVQHGAAPRVAPTEIVVAAAGSASELTLTVRNTGDRAPAAPAPAGTGAGTGTGLARLRERLAVLYGSAARLACRPIEEGGYEAVLVVPRQRGAAA